MLKIPDDDDDDDDDDIHWWMWHSNKYIQQMCVADKFELVVKCQHKVKTYGAICWRWSPYSYFISSGLYEFWFCHSFTPFLYCYWIELQIAISGSIFSFNNSS